jgi:hypothetical protein
VKRLQALLATTFFLEAAAVFFLVPTVFLVAGALPFLAGVALTAGALPFLAGVVLVEGLFFCSERDGTGEAGEHHSESFWGRAEAESKHSARVALWDLCSLTLWTGFMPARAVLTLGVVILERGGSRGRRVRTGARWDSEIQSVVGPSGIGTGMVRTEATRKRGLTEK